MTRRGVVLGAGTGATLLLAAWVSAAGSVGLFESQVFSGKESSAPGENFAPEGLDAEQDPPPTVDSNADPFIVSLVEFVLKALVVLVVLVVLVAIARALLERWEGRAGGEPDEVTADVLPAVLLESAREGEELLTHGTPGNAVIAAWVALEDAVRSAGVRDDRARTSEELVTAVLRSYAVDRAPLDSLAALYREARFSTHPLGEDTRVAAREAIRHVQADLRRVVPQGARRVSA